MNGAVIAELSTRSPGVLIRPAKIICIHYYIEIIHKNCNIKEYLPYWYKYYLNYI